MLAMADLHGDRGIYQSVPRLVNEHNVQALVLAGDLLSAPDGFPTLELAQRASAQYAMDVLSTLKVPVFYIMGNDDFVELQSIQTHVQSVHGRRVDLGRYNFVGYQYSLPFMGGIFEKTEKSIAADLSTLEPLMDEQTVLVTHSPAYGILDLGILDRHAGSPAILASVTRRSVRAHIHGHIHECFGREGRHFNVAAAGRPRAIVVDLATMEHNTITWKISG
jgi:Icc-related predicted phosphoesterase